MCAECLRSRKPLFHVQLELRLCAADEEVSRCRRVRPGGVSRASQCCLLYVWAGWPAKGRCPLVTWGLTVSASSLTHSMAGSAAGGAATRRELCDEGQLDACASDPLRGGP
jgi:hypothetical protein